MKETETAWAAGYVDGEGCINITKNTSYGHIVRVTIDSTDNRSLLVLLNLFGGRLNGPYEPRNKDSYNRKPIWVYSLCGVEAQSALKKMRPYLVIKQEQAELALRFPTYKKGGTRKKLKEGDFELRETLVVQLHTLKGK